MQSDVSIYSTVHFDRDALYENETQTVTETERTFTTYVMTHAIRLHTQRILKNGIQQQKEDTYKHIKQH